MREEETVVYNNYLGMLIRAHLSTVARKYIGAPNTLPDGIFWYRKGNIHKLEEIQKFSKQFIEPLLSEECFLIGDTAFLINHPPHDVHIDCPNLKDGIKGYKSVVIPLEIDTDTYPMLYTAEQYFYGPTTRCRAGCEEFDVDEETQRQKENVPYSTLKGISVEKENEWKPGNVIIFDSSRIHFAEKIQKVGASYKLGLSLNYATV
jgi:hypothetical protein